MSILATSAIITALADGAIVCEPMGKFQGAHIDITLGEYSWLFEPIHGAIDITDADPRDHFSLHHNTVVIELPARGFMLAHTAEYIGTAQGSGLIPNLHTRSTFARWGLSVCTANAGQGDEGYATRWTLEITNPHDIDIYLPVGARIGSISFHRAEGTASAYTPGTRYNATPQAWQPSDMLPRRGNW
jgi:deoxycytidine triphosphate deaminase